MLSITCSQSHDLWSGFVTRKLLLLTFQSRLGYFCVIWSQGMFIQIFCFVSSLLVVDHSHTVLSSTPGFHPIIFTDLKVYNKLRWTVRIYGMYRVYRCPGCVNGQIYTSISRLRKHWRDSNLIVCCNKCRRYYKGTDQHDENHCEVRCPSIVTVFMSFYFYMERRCYIWFAPYYTEFCAV